MVSVGGTEVKISIGITGPDLINGSGGSLNHALSVISLIAKEYNIIFVPGPNLVAKYRKNTAKTMETITRLRDLNVIVPKFIEEAVNGKISNKVLMRKYKGDLHVDFVFNFNQDFPLLSDDFTYALSIIQGVKFSVCFQNPCFGDKTFLSYSFDSMRLSLLGGNLHSFLFRIYQYLRMVRVINKTLSKEGPESIFIINGDCQQKITKNFTNSNLLSPANGIANPIDLKFFDLSVRNEQVMKKNQILFFARLSYSKGIFDLKPILSEILKEKDTKLIVVGKFDHSFERTIFLKRMKPYIESGKLVYKDFLENEEFYQEISESKVMIYPSHSDAYPIGVLQSLYFKTPVVAYEIPALSIYKQFNAVRLVREFDVANFSKEVVNLLNITDSSLLFSETISEFIKNHSWGNVARQYEMIFDLINEVD